jgi:hypothetical protein
MPKQKLMEELVNRYEDSAIAGKSAKDAGVSYSPASKCFTLKFDVDEHELIAKFLADHPQGGDELEQNIKNWIKNG